MMKPTSGSALPFLLLLTAPWTGCAAPAPEPAPLDAYSLPYHLWQDPYAPEVGDKRFFDIRRLREEFGLDRLEACEVQNLYRDLLQREWDSRGLEMPTELDPRATGDRVMSWPAQVQKNAFDAALGRVRRGELESRWSAVRAEESEVIVVFDLDETLLSDDWGEPPTVAFAPDAWDAIRACREMGAAVCIFTAKPDRRALRVLEDHRTPEGRALSQLVDAVFTNHHLVLQERDRRAGDELAAIPTKDLRIVDPSLEKVVLIDDNPSRVMQHANLRHVAPWDGGGHGDPPNEHFFETRLTRAVSEVRESLEWAKAHDVSFSKAFHPYSHAARRHTEDLARAAFDGDLHRAVEHMRGNGR